MNPRDLLRLRMFTYFWTLFLLILLIISNILAIPRELYDYTVIGDTVNTAARLESVTKGLGHTILISESVLAKCKEEHFSCKTELLGTYRLKGREQPIHVYTLSDER